MSAVIDQDENRQDLRVSRYSRGTAIRTGVHDRFRRCWIRVSQRVFFSSSWPKSTLILEDERTNQQTEEHWIVFIWPKNDVLCDLSSEDISCGKTLGNPMHTADVLGLAVYHVRCLDRSETNGNVSCRQTMSFAAASDDGIQWNAVARGIPWSTYKGTSARTVSCTDGCVDDGNTFRYGEEFSSPHWRIYQSVMHSRSPHEISLHERLGGGAYIG